MQLWLHSYPLAGAPGEDITTGLKAYWSFDATTKTGDTYADLTGNGNTLTITNGATNATGKVGDGALWLQDTNSAYAWAADSPTLNVPVLGPGSSNTLACWVKVGAYPVGGKFPGIVMKNDTTKGYGLYYEGGLKGLDGTSAVWNPTDPVSVATNVWYHVCVVFDNATYLAIYTNGVQYLGSNYVGGLIATNGNPLYIGRYYVTPETYGYFDGYVDEVRIYNRVLTQPQIQRLANQ